MLTLHSSVRVLLHREPVDFRKSHDGLTAIVRAHLREDPLNGDLFVFINRSGDRVKLLQWDGNGLWLHYKRLERGTFRMPCATTSNGARISRAELSMLLDGIELKKGKVSQRFAPALRIERRNGDGDPQRATSE